MSLTPEAYRERKWGDFPALRKALEDKKIPDHYYGWSSASDNMFDRLARLLEIVVLIHEFKNEMISLARSGCSDQLIQDLDLFEKILKDTKSSFSDGIEEVRKLKIIISKISLIDDDQK